MPNTGYLHEELYICLYVNYLHEEFAITRWGAILKAWVGWANWIPKNDRANNPSEGTPGQSSYFLVLLLGVMRFWAKGRSSHGIGASSL